MFQQENYDDASKQKDRMTAMVGTIIFVVGLLIAFLILGFKTPLPLPEEEGAYVLLGETDFGSNQATPQPVTKPKSVPEETQVQESQPSESNDEVITQDVDDAPVIEKQTEKKDTETPPEEKPEAKPDETEQDETPEKEERKSNPMFEFNKTGNEDGGQGDDNKEGVKGSPDGDPNAKKFGDGGGDGCAFNLKGRGLVKGPPAITGKNQNPERVVVEITVNKQGKVIKAIPVHKGGATMTTGPLVQKALSAARKLEFTPNPDAFEEQIGTVTFNFKPYK